jgi:hypothetical protein
MHPTSTFDVILLGHAERIAAADRTRSRRAPEPERPPEHPPHWAWSLDLLPVPLVGAVAR